MYKWFIHLIFAVRKGKEICEVMWNLHHLLLSLYICQPLRGMKLGILGRNSTVLISSPTDRMLLVLNVGNVSILSNVKT
jgi:hypothetical protein